MKKNYPMIKPTVFKTWAFIGIIALSSFSYKTLNAQIDASFIMPLYEAPIYPGIAKGASYFQNNLNYFGVEGNNLSLKGGAYSFNLINAPSSWGAVSFGAGLSALAGKTPPYDLNLGKYIPNSSGNFIGQYAAQQTQQGTLLSLWIPIHIMWTFQPIKIGRASVLLMAGGRTMFSYGKITTPAVDTSGHKVSIDVNSFKWIGGRLNGILGVQVALPLGKFKIAPYVIHYSLSNPANWGMDGGPKDNLGVQSINGAHPVLNEKQKVICLGADIINISHGIALGISMTHVPSTEYAFFGNVEATTASSKSTTTAYNMLSVSLIFYSAALNK